VFYQFIKNNFFIKQNKMMFYTQAVKSRNERGNRECEGEFCHFHVLSYTTFLGRLRAGERKGGTV
ncbi:hypothetical protein ACPCYY_21510, partial [Bacillus pumilus]